MKYEIIKLLDGTFYQVGVTSVKEIVKQEEPPKFFRVLTENDQFSNLQFIHPFEVARAMTMPEYFEEEDVLKQMPLGTQKPWEKIFKCIFEMSTLDISESGKTVNPSYIVNNILDYCVSVSKDEDERNIYRSTKEEIRFSSSVSWGRQGQLCFYDNNGGENVFVSRFDALPIIGRIQEIESAIHADMYNSFKETGVMTLSDKFKTFSLQGIDNYDANLSISFFKGKEIQNIQATIGKRGKNIGHLSIYELIALSVGFKLL